MSVSYDDIPLQWAIVILTLLDMTEGRTTGATPDQSLVINTSTYGNRLRTKHERRYEENSSRNAGGVTTISILLFCL